MKGGGQRAPVLKGATTPPEETRVNAPTVDRAKLHPAARMADTVRGADIIAAIKAGGVKTVVALPDIVAVSSVLKPLANDSDIRSCASARRTRASASARGFRIATSVPCC